MVNKVLPPGKKRSADYYEIAVVGGGLAGLVAAATMAGPLAAKGQQLALVEAQPFASHLTPAFDGRTTAIAWQGQQLLREIGLWPQLAKLAEPIKQIRVADTFATPGLTFDSNELAKETNSGAFGYIIENRHLRTILLAHLRSQKNIDIYNPASVSALDLAGPTATLTLDNGSQLNAALVLAADGKNSALRKLIDIDTFDLAYNQKALVCVVACAAPHHNIALEHFLPEGPFAMLPMQPDENGTTMMSIVWTVKPDTAVALLALGEADFIAAMVEAGAGYMQPLHLATPVAAFPLSLRHARHYTAPHLALLGEAAHAIHPIAGQGFNLGLRDIACLRDSLIAAHARGLRADDASVLGSYSRQRRADNQRMVGATDLLDRLFSTGHPMITRLRQRGLAAVNANGPLRRFFMKQAMGFKTA